jgi:hypothetical protein
MLGRGGGKAMFGFYFRRKTLKISTLQPYQIPMAIAKSNPHTLIVIFQTTLFHQYTGKEIQYLPGNMQGHEISRPIYM